MSAQTEQPGTAIFRRPQLGKPLRAAEDDVWHTGQRLRIINDRRSAPQPDHSRKGRPNSGNAALAFERFHERRLFTNFVSTGSAMPIHIEVVAATKNVLSQKAARVGILDRLLHD